MRIGDVLSLRGKDIEDRKISLTHPKSGKESERVFLPQKVAECLNAYIIKKEICLSRRQRRRHPKDCRTHPLGSRTLSSQHQPGSIVNHAFLMGDIFTVVELDLLFRER